MRKGLGLKANKRNRRRADKAWEATLNQQKAQVERSRAAVYGEMPENMHKVFLLFELRKHYGEDFDAARAEVSEKILSGLGATSLAETRAVISRRALDFAEGSLSS